MWPSIKFDPIKLFDLCPSDLVFHDPFFVSSLIESMYKSMGDEFLIALIDLPEVVAHFADACPDKAVWLESGISKMRPQLPDRITQVQARLLSECWSWNLGMAKSPAIWDALPWSHWDPSAIYDNIDLEGKVVLDIGAGTGQVTLRCAPLAKMVYALEPVARLRRYIEQKMDAAGLENVRTIFGILENIPLADQSTDAAILSNGSFGWKPEKELDELERVTRPGGTILMLGPCNFGNESVISVIKSRGYDAFEFEVPCDGMKPAFIKRLK